VPFQQQLLRLEVGLHARENDFVLRVSGLVNFDGRVKLRSELVSRGRECLALCFRELLYTVGVTEILSFFVRDHLFDGLI